MTPGSPRPLDVQPLLSGNILHHNRRYTVLDRITEENSVMKKVGSWLEKERSDKFEVSMEEKEVVDDRVSVSSSVYI